MSETKIKREGRGQPIGGRFAKHDRTPDTVTLTPKHKAIDVSEPMKYAEEARDPNTSQERLLQFADADSWLIHTNVATNPAAGEKVLDSLAGGYDNGVKFLVAQHPNTSPDTLHRLAGGWLRDNRAAAAANPNLALRDQITLAGDEDPSVQLSVLETHGHNPEVREALKKSRFYVIHERLAKQIGTTAS